MRLNHQEQVEPISRIIKLESNRQNLYEIFHTSVTMSLCYCYLHFMEKYECLPTEIICTVKKIMDNIIICEGQMRSNILDEDTSGPIVIIDFSFAPKINFNIDDEFVWRPRSRDMYYRVIEQIGPAVCEEEYSYPVDQTSGQLQPA